MVGGAGDGLESIDVPDNDGQEEAERREELLEGRWGLVREGWSYDGARSRGIQAATGHAFPSRGRGVSGLLPDYGEEFVRGIHAEPSLSPPKVRSLSGSHNEYTKTKYSLGLTMTQKGKKWPGAYVGTGKMDLGRRDADGRAEESNEGDAAGEDGRGQSRGDDDEAECGKKARIGKERGSADANYEDFLFKVFQ